MDEHQVGGHPLLEPPGVVDPEKLAARARRGDEGLAGREASRDKELDLPR